MPQCAHWADEIQNSRSPLDCGCFLLGVPVGQIFPELVGVEGQRIEGLGDNGEDGQPPQVPPNVVGVHEPYRQAVAEDGEGQPSHPPEGRVSGEKDGAHVVHHHA